MNAIAEFTVIPIGVGVSLSEYVSACERVLEGTGLSYETRTDREQTMAEREARVRAKL